MATYSKSSPWYYTTQNQIYLEELRIRPIPAEPDDVDYVIQNRYQHRPDLLAYDLYGNAQLWWVFSQRNMNIIKDPIYDMEPGVIIKLPKKSNLEKYLGV